MRKKHVVQRYKGSFALIVITAMISTSLLSGCGEEDVYAISHASLNVNGTEVDVPCIAVINNKEISLDEYRYYFLNTKYTMDNGDETYWSEDGDGQKLRNLKSQALLAMEETYAVESLATELNLSLTKNELSQIEEDVKNQIDALGGSREYAQALQTNYLTDELYRFLWKTNFYCEKLWAYYFTAGGPFYVDNADAALTDEEVDETYQIKFKAMIAEAVDNLSVELSPEYDLITTESLT